MKIKDNNKILEYIISYGFLKHYFNKKFLNKNFISLYLLYIYSGNLYNVPDAFKCYIQY